MKKFKLMMTIAVLAVISYSCNNSAVQRMADKMAPDPVVLEQEGAGFFVNEPGEKFVVGSLYEKTFRDYSFELAVKW